MNAVHALRFQHKISTLCGVLKVNRSTYYKHFSKAVSDRTIQKQIATENRESELTAEITRLKKKNEEAAKRNATLEQKVQDYYQIREELRTTKNELGSLKAMYQKVLDFIEILKLTQKLQEFLKQKAREVKR